MRVQCFLLEHCHKARYTLRRYHSSSDPNQKCLGNKGFGYHNADGPLIAETNEDPDKNYYCTNPPPKPDKSDPRWPTKCDHCEYRFIDTDEWQVFCDPLYKRVDTGELMTLKSAPAGAMWDAEWWPEKGPDGKVLVVKLPDGYDWMIDGKANNCSCPPNQTGHFCWTRSGTAPLITANPSILTPGYHGWLRSGYLESC